MVFLSINSMASLNTDCASAIGILFSWSTRTTSMAAFLISVPSIAVTSFSPAEFSAGSLGFSPAEAMAAGLSVEAGEEDGFEFRCRLIHVLRFLDGLDSEERAHEEPVFFLPPQHYD